MKWHQNKVAAWAAASAVVISLAACGGGGGESTPAVKNVNVAAFVHNWLRANKQWALQGTGTVGSQSGPMQMTLSLAAGSPAPFVLNNVTGNTNIRTVTIGAGNNTATTIETVFFDDADHFFGEEDNSGGCAALTASDTPLPTAAAIGASGSLYAAQSFTACSLVRVPVSTSNATWSVENDGGVILVCENSKQVIGGSELNGSTCLESDANGNIGTRARVLISQGNVSFSARNY